MASSSSSEKKMIFLKSNDGQTFEVEEAAARMSKTVEKKMEEDDCVDGVISLTGVDSATLSKALEYCKFYAGVSVSAAQGEDVCTKDFAKNYAASVEEDSNILFNLTLAANYLNIKPLLDLLCQTIANMIRGKTAEEQRDLFHIKRDYNSDEEAEVRKECAWAFE